MQKGRKRNQTLNLSGYEAVLLSTDAQNCALTTPSLLSKGTHLIILVGNCVSPHPYNEEERELLSSIIWKRSSHRSVALKGVAAHREGNI